MQSNTPQRIVRDGRSAESHIQTPQVGEAQSEDFGRGIAQRAAEGEVQVLQGAAAAHYSDDGLVGEVGAVCEDEAAQVFELVDSPGMETRVGD
jgi:hypothetical protein